MRNDVPYRNREKQDGCTRKGVGLPLGLLPLAWLGLLGPRLGAGGGQPAV